MSGDYKAASTLTEHEGTSTLALATALGVTPDGLVENPTFFSGFPDRPDVLAAGLLAVADVAGTRYADFGLAQRVANLDPVVTAGGDILRFESFSACNGVHARLDVLAEGLGASTVGFGTTNVDINPPLRAALARTSRTETLHLTVGHEGLTASTPAASQSNARSPCPTVGSEASPRSPPSTPPCRTAAPSSDPPSASCSAPSHASRHRAPSFTSCLRPAPGASPPTAPNAPSPYPAPPGSEAPNASRGTHDGSTSTSPPTGSTAWVFELPGSRLTLVLSPEPYRAFSGEGGLLMWLNDPSAETYGLALLPLLGWEPTIDPDRLANTSGLSTSKVTTGLAWLAASGRLGYDLTARAWFHRELPVDVAKVLRRNPRLLSAQRLLEQDKVSQVEPGTWLVAGSGKATYQIHADKPAGTSSDTLEFNRPKLVCQCPWEEKHHGTRGPCKHVLAVALSLRGESS